VIAIWKFPINVTLKTELTMPKGAQVLDVQAVRDTPDDVVLWAVVNTGAPEETRTFEVFNTGALPSSLGQTTYIGSFQVHDRMGGRVVEDLFVGHLFEVT
jgi:hypothetical protein